MIVSISKPVFLTGIKQTSSFSTFFDEVQDYGIGNDFQVPVAEIEIMWLCSGISLYPHITWTNHDISRLIFYVTNINAFYVAMLLTSIMRMHLENVGCLVI